MRALATILLCFDLALTGCVFSFTPLYEENDSTFDPALIGTWRPADSSETWSSARYDAHSYRVVTIDEKGRKGEFSGHLVVLDGKQFLDLYPRPQAATVNSYYADHWIAAHTIVRLLSTKPDVEFAILDQDWLSGYLAEHPAALPHAVVRGDLVLTANTKELRQFLAANLETPGVFRPLSVLRRVARSGEKKER